MWIFTEIGFFSAVENYFEHDHVLVRGRFKVDLINLQKMIFKEEGIEFELLNTPSNDYHYRLNIPKDIWGRICQKLASTIDYHNFKGHVHGDSIRDKAYMGCWNSMYQAQNQAERYQ